MAAGADGHGAVCQCVSSANSWPYPEALPLPTVLQPPGLARSPHGPLPRLPHLLTGPSGPPSPSGPLNTISSQRPFSVMLSQSPTHTAPSPCSHALPVYGSSPTRIYSPEGRAFVLFPDPSAHLNWQVHGFWIISRGSDPL